MSWPIVRLGEVVQHRKAFITIDDATEYKRCRVQLHAKGVVLRDRVPGAEIKTKQQQVCRAGELLVAEIDAKVGGFGIIPVELDGAIVSSHYFLFAVDDEHLDRRFLDYYIRTRGFRDQVTAQGSTNYAAIRPSHVLEYRIPLPPLSEQRRIVAKIEELAGRIEEARGLREEVAATASGFLRSVYSGLVATAECKPLGLVAPLVRRRVSVEADGQYPELGIRSFGKGTFHKPSLAGVDVGTKKLYRIEAGDLLFNNVFAWEGAVAVAGPEDAGRVGSHRFITCLPRNTVVTADFLRFYFLTEEGLSKLGKASPGGAGRNRTLGLKALEGIYVPVISFGKQLWFDDVQARVREANQAHARSALELDALLPSILDKAFTAEL